MRLIVYAGKEFKADFTVVSGDGITPEVLDAADTATITVISSGLSPTCIISDVDLVLIDATNGLFELTLSAEQTALLKQDIGFKEDNYSSLSNYDGYISFVLVSGNRETMVNLYVKEAPACPVT